ncbi:PREDICTED: xaa-Pro aminopeptidase 1-like isoform X1 [Amphimedon queenslandica]|uniref:Aminopeptidase P N-terminal domain-containing protein n=2 Tax=Amphimedon queenslandica TaxID=400682 RepID=A0AAN0IYN1_AMPQE|nr:PREDICTED: xaa-Pro aminopeptidase 1-like isoform X1 [Amphimedon queenslandica]|eukprot:XP_019849652.1 PREDICTED: xaa-Pro aminopeptidase 1-like isoform X1 [Amphimedon queenslandica]
MSTALSRLRALMKSLPQDPISAYIIPTDDQHQSEYIAECDKRRQYMTGFTGSAGIAVVTSEQALLWTDGRYHIQAADELGHEWTLMKQGVPNVPTIMEWVKKEMKPGSFIGYDPSLISEELYQMWNDFLDGCGISLCAVLDNLVDQVWDDRPPPPNNPVFSQPIEYSGQSWQDKVERIREKLKEEGCSALVCTALDENAWLYNLRGSDIEYNPVFFSYSMVTMDDARLYLLNESALTSDATSQLCIGEVGGVILRPYKEISSDIIQLLSSTEGKIWINSPSSQGLCSLVPKDRRVNKLSPVPLMKGIKNENEIKGMKQAHIKCAVALCEYYNWLENQIKFGKEITELAASDKLETFRKEQDFYVSPSFPTISASGAHAALCHYRPTVKTDKLITDKEIYLCDTGCQFRDGTTDVTRTMHFGNPTDKQKECFTRVLKGNIALCTAVFPEKTPGPALDAFARLPLWKAGLNYRHGTGHGVGAFLNVHEGPHGIGGSRNYSEPLYGGMFVSDEPGYYEDGEFGIRIENIVLIKPVETKYQFGGSPYLTMEPVTLVPIQLKMIAPELLTEDEVSWLNDYHTQVRDTLSPVLIDQGRTEAHQWLINATQLLG